MKLLITIVCVTILIAGTVAVSNLKAPVEGRNFDANAPLNSATSHGVIFATTMLIGIVFGHLYRCLEGRQEPVSLKRLMEFLQAGALWRSLLASPIIFGVVYTAAGKQPDFLLACVLAFENGFLCPIILKGKLDPADPPSGG